MWGDINRHRDASWKHRAVRVAVIVAILLLGFGQPDQAIGMTRVFGYWHSSKRPRITVQYEGVPVAGVKVEIWRGERTTADPLYTVSTDAEGMPLLPRLSYGKYSLYFSTEKKLRSDLALNVQPWRRDKSSRFTVELECCSAPTYDELFAAAKREPVQAFRGIVVDMGGSPIARASIDVVLAGTLGKTHVIQVLSR